MKKYYIYNKKLNDIYVLTKLVEYGHNEIELSEQECHTYILCDPTICIIDLTNNYIFNKI